jgi:ribosomal protein L37AE/L43A
MAEASGHPFDPGDHDPDLVDDNHLCHECGHPRRLHVSEVEVAMPWTCDVCGREITTRAEAVEHAQSKQHREAMEWAARLTEGSPSPPPASTPSLERQIVSRPPPTVDAFERGYREGYGYARWRGSLQRPPPSRHWWTGTHGSIIWEYDLFDWTIRVFVLLIGLLVGFAAAHAF